MIRTVLALVKGNKAISNKKAKVEPLMMTATKAVYRDELTTKKQPQMKKRVRFADSEPTILGEDNEKYYSEKRSCISNNEKEGITRVKVRLTKEQAAQLLTKCNGRVLEFNELARELVSIPINQVSIVSTHTNNL